MLLKVLSVAVFAAVVGPLAAQAQTVAQIGGPAENPPAGFKGQQYVDSRGCVFLKAGIGGQVNWVPRVSRSRKALCGFPPTGTTPAPIAVADDIQPVAPVVVAQVPVVPAPAAKPSVRAPMETIASLPQQRSGGAAPVVVPRVVAQPAPYAAAPPRQTYELATGNGVPQGKIGCYTSAPVAQRVKLTNGGTAVVCTRGDGSLTGWRPPVYANGAGVGAALDYPVAQQTIPVGRAGTAPAAPVQDYAAADAAPAMPKGYKMAWTDGRLNPNRGRAAAEGQAAQDQIWTRDIPAQLVADKSKTKKTKKVTVSTRNAATEAVQPRAKASGGVWLQVGTFGVPANAQGAAQRLSSMGLPVAKSRLNKGGKTLEIVLAGPFGSAADAQAALSMARNAGFGDAFLR